MAEQIIRDYLDRPPYYGRSGFQHVAAVKTLCGPTCTWDPVRKLWGTKCTEALQDLVGSGKWHPIGIEYEWKGRFLKAAQDHRAEAEARWMQEEEAKRKAAAEAEAAAEALKRRSPASWVLGSSAPKKPKTVGASTLAPAAAPAAARPPAPPTVKRDDRVGPPPTDAEARECERLGFTQQAIVYSMRDVSLGPRMTLSAEGRLLRWCSFMDRKEEDGPLVEYTREERKTIWNSEQRFPLPETESRAYAVELNKKAKRFYESGGDALA